MNKRALLALNGELPSKELVSRLLPDVELFICTDGAANRLWELGLEPELIIGDLDSLEEKPRADHTAQIIERPSQYATDFEKALDHLKELGFVSISIVGLKGKRFDHSFTNISILCEQASKFEVTLHDDDGYGVLLNETNRSLSCTLERGSIVSLLPLLRAEQITTSGLMYPLSNESLEFGVRNGQSNQAVDESVSVELGSGTLMVYILNPLEKQQAI